MLLKLKSLESKQKHKIFLYFKAHHLKQNQRINPYLLISTLAVGGYTADSITVSDYEYPNSLVIFKNQIFCW